jgi:C-terminal processing protease CtpA/Prc
MKKFTYLIAAFLLSLTLFVSCSKDDDPKSEPDPTKVILENPINDFVWKGMNSWYNWQPNVSNLSDSKDNIDDDYYTYLNMYATPESLFETLLYDKGNIDRFSWFIEDYVEQQKSFQGVTVTTGIRRSVPIGAGNNQVLIYAQHVTAGSPADIAGIKRGDIINQIDGEVMNETNYASVINKLYSGNSIVVSTAKLENDLLVKLNDFTITPVEVSDNPVHFAKVFDDINGKKVGYLVYNGFRSSYNDELNAAFETFKSSGVTELILDLRINGGGSVETSAYLASMIDENAGSDTFAELKFNAKHSSSSGKYYFDDELNVYDVNGLKTGTQVINRLKNITKLYVLVTGSTASASEMIINGLKPFIPVKLIGETTYGKNVGSITLYDSPGSDYTNESTAKATHKNAMQPIVFQIYNKLGQSDYTLGFTPDIKIEEWKSWRSILPYGDENEVMLKAALDDIRGITSKQSLKVGNEIMLDENLIKKVKFENEMYLGSEYFNQN